MMALGPSATTMYLPAFPAMAEALGVGTEQIQLTLSTYMIGLAAAQLACGPLADRFGRKPMMLVGLTLFALGSVGCMVAGNISALLSFRFVQAVGAAAGIVLAQATVRDSFSPADAARTLAYMGSITALAPAVAPILGGFLLLWFGWQAVFLVLALAALLVTAAVAAALTESLPPSRRQALHPLTVLHNYRSVAQSRIFLGHSLSLSLMYAGNYSFMASAPFVLIEVLGVSTERFGWYFLCTVASFIIGNLTGARLSRHISGHNLIRLGGVLLTIGGGLMLALVISGQASAAALIGAQMVFSVGSGLMMPQLIAGALMPFHRIAGTAAALMGCIQMGGAAIASATVGYLYDGTPLPVAAMLALTGVGSMVVYLYGRQ